MNAGYHACCFDFISDFLQIFHSIRIFFSPFIVPASFGEINIIDDNGFEATFLSICNMFIYIFSRDIT